MILDRYKLINVSWLYFYKIPLLGITKIMTKKVQDQQLLKHKGYNSIAFYSKNHTYKQYLCKQANL